jgi:uncharacterized membrane protein SpoIIM required for sporulation
MSTTLAGFAVGLAFGVMDYLLFSFLARRAEHAEARNAMRRIAVGTLVTMPIAGLIVGYVLGMGAGS